MAKTYSNLVWLGIGFAVAGSAVWYRRRQVYNQLLYMISTDPRTQNLDTEATAALFASAFTSADAAFARILATLAPADRLRLIETGRRPAGQDGGGSMERPEGAPPAGGSSTMERPDQTTAQKAVETVEKVYDTLFPHSDKSYSGMSMGGWNDGSSLFDEES